MCEINNNFELPSVKTSKNISNKINSRDLYANHSVLLSPKMSNSPNLNNFKSPAPKNIDFFI